MSQPRMRKACSAVSGGRARGAPVKASGDSIPGEPHCILRPKERSRRSTSKNKIPRSIRYDLENALVGLCNVWFEEIKPHLVRNKIKVHLHEGEASGDHVHALAAAPPLCSHLHPESSANGCELCRLLFNAANSIESAVSQASAALPPPSAASHAVNAADSTPFQHSEVTQRLKKRRKHRHPLPSSYSRSYKHPLRHTCSTHVQTSPRLQSKTQTVLSHTFAINYTQPSSNPKIKDVSTQTDATQLVATKVDTSCAHFSNSPIRGPKSATRGQLSPMRVPLLQNQPLKLSFSPIRNLQSPCPESPMPSSRSPSRFRQSQTRYLKSPIRSPPSPIRCPQSQTLCPKSPPCGPMSPNRFPQSQTRCLKSPTPSHPSPILCPKAPTRSPLSPTRLLQSETQCLMSPSRCPLLPSRCPKSQSQYPKAQTRAPTSPTVSRTPRSPLCPNSSPHNKIHAVQKQLRITESRPLFSFDIIDMIGEAYDTKLRCLYKSPVRNADSSSIMNLMLCPVSSKKTSIASKKPWR